MVLRRQKGGFFLRRKQNVFDQSWYWQLRSLNPTAVLSTSSSMLYFTHLKTRRIFTSVAVCKRKYVLHERMHESKTTCSLVLKTVTQECILWERNQVYEITKTLENFFRTSSEFATTPCLLTHTCLSLCPQRGTGLIGKNGNHQNEGTGKSVNENSEGPMRA